MEATGRLLLNGEVRLLSMRIKNNPMEKKQAGRQGPPGPLLGVRPDREAETREWPTEKTQKEEPKQEGGTRVREEGTSRGRFTEPRACRAACPARLGFHVTATAQGRAGEGQTRRPCESICTAPRPWRARVILGSQGGWEVGEVGRWRAGRGLREGKWRVPTGLLMAAGQTRQQAEDRRTSPQGTLQGPRGHGP